MRIILWAPFGAGTHYWGPGTSAFRLYKSLEGKDIQITLVHASPEQGLFPNVFSEQIRIGTLKKDSKLSSVIFLLKSFLWISKNYKDYNAFHGITAFYYTFLPAVYFNRLGGKAFIKITGGNGGFGNNSKISKFTGFSKFRLSCSNSISGYISISSHIKSNLIRSGVKKEKIFSIPNGVDENRFIPISNETKKYLRKINSIPDKFTFTYIGGLTHNKRVINIIHSIKSLKNEGIKDFQFLIVGPDRVDGVIEEEIERLVYDLELESNVIHVKHTENPEVFFQLSDAFILVSETEGMSNSLLEAMSCGLPAIVTKISGSEDLIKEGLNGVYTDASSEDIALCMKGFLLESYDIKRFGANNRNKIIKHYANNIVMKKHINLFSNEN